MGHPQKLWLAAVQGWVADVAAGYEVDHVFGDVGGVVADALQVAGYKDQIDRGGDRPGSRCMWSAVRGKT